MPSDPTGWLIFLSGWVATGVLLGRDRARTRAISNLLTLADQAVQEAQALADSVYRVRLSCPLCDWTDVVVREAREEAQTEGNRRITLHNQQAGHQLPGTPRMGYYKGEPLN